jgi:dienelactone hydrolase
LASEGFVVIKYESDSPAKALEKIITNLNSNSKALGIDTERIGFWSISSNPQTVLSFLALGDENLQAQIKCSVFYSPDLRLKGLIQFSTLHHVPYFIAIGLKDDPLTVKFAKKFAEQCEETGLVYEYYEHPEGAHGFDALQDDETTHSIIKATLEFYKEYL